MQKGKKIEFSDIRAIDRQYAGQIHQAIESVISSGHFVKGEQVREFEQQLREYLGTADVVTCGNGTDALLSAIASLDLKKGDEVITTPFSFVSAVECICLASLTPIFADIDPDNFNINPENIEKLITPKTRAIIPVHLYGHPCDMLRIMEIARRHHLYVIEDVAQALGSEIMIDGKMKKLGTIGDLACTSFFPTKTLGCYGDGGAVIVSSAAGAGNDAKLLERVRAFVNHGSRRKYENEMVGVNSRLDTIQAAILSVKLNFLDQQNQQRREIAKHYNEQLKDNEAIVLPEICDGHVFHLYVIRVKDGRREELMKYLENKGVQTLVHYPKAIHNLAPYRQYVQEPLPYADMAEKEVLSMPMYPGLENDKIDYICGLINEWSK